MKLISKFAFFGMSIVFFLIGCDGSGGSTDLTGLLLTGQNSISTSENCPPGTIDPDYLLANTVVSAPGNNPSIRYKDPEKAINGVCGGGQNSGGIDVYTIGSADPNNFLILSWNGATVPNGTGVDFIVFENGFQQQGSINYFIEPVIVEVSLDGTNYCGFNPQYTGAASPASLDPTDWIRFGGANPVLWNMLTHPLTPQEIFPDPFVANAGGDSFDLDDLSLDARFANGCDSAVLSNLQTNGFKFIKLLNAKGQSTFPSPAGSFDGGPDIDGIIAKSVTP